MKEQRYYFNACISKLDRIEVTYNRDIFHIRTGKVPV